MRLAYRWAQVHVKMNEVNELGRGRGLLVRCKCAKVNPSLGLGCTYISMRHTTYDFALSPLARLDNDHPTPETFLDICIREYSHPRPHDLSNI